MSKFSQSLSTSYSLSITAMEEASRVGQREADIDHLFLAIAVSEQTAGQVLRGLGISIDAVRDAVAALHAEQLAGLGIQADVPGPGRIVFHETEGYEWGERAVKIIQEANSSGKRGDAAAVLRDLVGEPSGMIESILRRLGSSPDAVRAELDRVEGLATQRGIRKRGDALSGAVEAFIPAPIDEVWRLLSDASRLPDWDPMIGSVENGDVATRVGQVWSTRARSTRPDGTSIKVKRQYVNQKVQVAALDHAHLVEWELTLPDAPGANSRYVSISMEPAAEGTQLQIGFAWVRHSTSSWRRIRGFFFRPVNRYLLWIHLAQLRAGISRVFR